MSSICENSTISNLYSLSYSDPQSQAALQRFPLLGGRKHACDCCSRSTCAAVVIATIAFAVVDVIATTSDVIATTMSAADASILVIRLAIIARAAGRQPLVDPLPRVHVAEVVPQTTHAVGEARGETFREGSLHGPSINIPGR